jgi:hypothetical protein
MERKRASIRQSVTIPASLAAEVRRVARRNRSTMSGTLVALAQKGLEAEANSRPGSSKKDLDSAYRRFMAQSGTKKEISAGRHLIRSIFGKAAIADD